MSSGWAPIASDPRRAPRGRCVVTTVGRDRDRGRARSRGRRGTSTSKPSRGSRTTRTARPSRAGLGGVAAERSGSVGEAEARRSTGTDSTGVPSSRWHGTIVTTGWARVAGRGDRVVRDVGEIGVGDDDAAEPVAPEVIASGGRRGVERARVVEHRRARGRRPSRARRRRTPPRRERAGRVHDLVGPLATQRGRSAPSSAAARRALPARTPRIGITTPEVRARAGVGEHRSTYATERGVRRRPSP